MSIIQSFYDNLATQYDKLFLNWQATTREQAVLLDGLFARQGFDRSARVLDCACGIGTQVIGLAALGYDVTASDISEGELAEARNRAAANQVQVAFAQVSPLETARLVRVTAVFLGISSSTLLLSGL